VPRAVFIEEELSKLKFLSAEGPEDFDLEAGTVIVVPRGGGAEPGPGARGGRSTPVLSPNRLTYR